MNSEQKTGWDAIIPLVKCSHCAGIGAYIIPVNELDLPDEETHIGPSVQKYKYKVIECEECNGHGLLFDAGN